MIRALRNTLRLLQIGFVLAKHDALFIFRLLPFLPVLTFICGIFSRRIGGSEGKRLVAALEELGPTFVKLGQSLSTRADLIGEELARDLAQLQDNIAPFPSDEVKRIIEAELGKPVEELFLSFENTPAAAASIAQVHFAKTQEGADVAVKILRPNIEYAFARDIELFYWLAEQIEARMPRWKRLKPLEVVKTFEETIHFELDLRFEASSAVELALNLKNDTGFKVPAVYWHLTSRRVLTAERLFGIPISQVDAIRAAGHDLDAILQKAAVSFFNQVFRDGYFHADMHPGNLFVLANGDIGAVDFGIMGRIDRQSRIFLAEILRGFLNEDYLHVARVHIEAGYVPADKSADQFALACRAIAQPILGRNMNEISVARLLGQLFNIAKTFEMETQPQLLLLQKTMMVAEGVGRMLNPAVNMWQVAQPLVETWAKENLGPAARIQDAARETVNLVQMIPRIVRKLDRTLDELHARAVEFKEHTDERRSEWFYRQWLLIGWSGVVLMVIWLLR